MALDVRILPPVEVPIGHPVAGEVSGKEAPAGQTLFSPGTVSRRFEKARAQPIGLGRRVGRPGRE